MNGLNSSFYNYAEVIITNFIRIDLTKCVYGKGGGINFNIACKVNIYIMISSYNLLQPSLNLDAHRNID